MLQEINQLRADVGLRMLTIDFNLSKVARKHSINMAERDFFGHLDPDGFDANNRVRKAGMNCVVGENVGVYRTNNRSIHRVVFDLMDSFYKSESHRENILNPDFTHIGIGFYHGESSHSSIFDSEIDDINSTEFGVIFVTQNFYRYEITETEPDLLPTELNVGDEVHLSIRTVEEFDILTLHFEREGFFTEEYWVRTSMNESNTYSCRVKFSEKGRWACKVIAVTDSSKGLTRAIGQMEFVVN